jgi:dihydroorotase
VTTGTAAAAAGGFTSIACMANTNPVNDNSFVTSYLQQKIKEEALVNVYIIGAVTRGLKGEELAEIGSMAESGIVGLSDDGKTVMNSYLLRKALDYSKRFNLPVISHAEDCSLKGRGVMNEGFNSARFGLRGIPAASETLIVSRDLLLAELTGARVHIAHVSTEGSVRLIREAKRRGLQITAEVTPHHITLTDEACGTYDTNTKVAPPLRGPEDREALSEALADGTIDVVASDHAPHSVEDKQIEYDLAEFGMVGLETAFPLYHRQVLKKRFSLERLMEAMTIGPAKILGLEKNKGSLVVGKDGDVTLWNPETVFKVNKSEFRSKSKNTPFDGWQLQGQVVATIVGGRIVFSRLASDRPGGAQ